MNHMTVMSLVGFDAADLEANQHGYLSGRQYQMLLGRVVRAFEHFSHPMRVERFTGLVAVDEHQPSSERDGDYHLRIGGVGVVIEHLRISAAEVSEAFDAGRIYTPYCVEYDGRNLLLSIEEGPDWQGNTAGTVSAK